MTDNDLSCQQIDDATVPMDAVVMCAAQPAAKPQASQQMQQGVLLAQAHKEHLTPWFLSKGCKLGEMQRY